VQSYAALFGDRLFRFNSEDDQLVMSYDASYPQFNLAGKYRFNEKHLPFAHFSISDCYRYEQSGECMVLFRGRRFNMPDIHPYFKDVDQAWEWYPNIEKQLLNGFDLASRQFVNVAKVSSMKNWELYQDKIIEIAVEGAREVLVEIKLGDEERYWIVDIDYSFVDKLEQVREIGCIQIDVGNASRLGISYQGSDGESQNPVIIHSAIPGGIERYIYMLLDDMDRFPIYFQPVQLRLILVNEEFREYAQNIINAFPNIRIDVDDRAESVGKKIKDSHNELIPNYVVIGEKEMAQDRIPSSVKAVVEDIENRCKGLPSIQCSIPRYLSRRIHI
jgi:threonyl-tRNA synthetase